MERKKGLVVGNILPRIRRGCTINESSRRETKGVYYTNSLNNSIYSHRRDKSTESKKSNVTFESIDDILQHEYKNPININNSIVKKNRQIWEDINLFYTERGAKLKSLKDEEKIIAKPEPKAVIPRVILKPIFHKRKGRNKDPTFVKEMKRESRNNLLAELILQGVFGLCNGLRPCSRIYSTFTLYNDILYIVAGMATIRLFDIWGLKEIEDKYIWERCSFKSDTPITRSGHTTVAYKGSLYIFGGKVGNVFLPKDDITVINLSSKEISTPMCSNKLELKWRRNHIAIGVGYHMYIHGGIDELDHYLSDSYILDLRKYKWTKLVDPKPIEPVAFHSAALVLHPERKQTDISFFKMPDLMSNTKLRYEGLYIFGGMNGTGECNNDLRILRIGRQAHEWIEPTVTGRPPSPRYSCTITYYDKTDLLLLHAGRSGGEIFNDLYALDLYTFNWSKVIINDNPPKNRFGHSAEIINDRLLIFGGLDGKEYVGSELYCINMNFYESYLKSKRKSSIDSSVGEYYKYNPHELYHHRKSVDLRDTS
jgi:hypothetical protein